VTRSVVALVALATLASVGCAPSHIMSYTPKERDYKPGKYAQRDPSLQPSRGSLFSDAQGGFLEDTRAVRVGDIVLIKIDESADASGNSTTQLQRNSNADLGVTNVLGLVGALKTAAPMFDPSHILSWMSSADFAGQGNTSRTGELRGNVAVRVAREMPNGDLFLEGTKVILINYEEYHLYISGLVRRADIAEDNTVMSSRIADAEVEFTGRGDIDDQQRKGILGRALDKANPF
jgi:flagellar L-ring protein precursor FlgH